MDMFHMRAIVLLIMLVLLIPALAAAQSTNQAESTVTVDLMAKNLSFNVNSITVPAGSNVVINFDNQDSGIPHNFAVYTDSSANTIIFKGPIITGINRTTYTFAAPNTPGTYFFRCDVHPTQMTGEFIVSAAAVTTTPATPTSQTNITIINNTNVTQPNRSTPGFEGFFAITGLLTAAYLIFGRRR